MLRRSPSSTRPLSSFSTEKGLPLPSSSRPSPRTLSRQLNLKRRWPYYLLLVTVTLLLLGRFSSTSSSPNHPASKPYSLSGIGEERREAPPVRLDQPPDELLMAEDEMLVEDPVLSPEEQARVTANEATEAESREKTKREQMQSLIWFLYNGGEMTEEIVQGLSKGSGEFRELLAGIWEGQKPDEEVGVGHAGSGGDAANAAGGAEAGGGGAGGAGGHAGSGGSGHGAHGAHGAPNGQGVAYGGNGEIVYSDPSPASAHSTPPPLPELFPGNWALESRLRTRLTVFSKSYCPYSRRAKSVLETYPLDPPPFIIELDHRDDMALIQDTLRTLTGRRTVPNVVVDFESIGGSDEVGTLHGEGGLEKLLMRGQTKFVFSENGELMEHEIQ